MKETRRSLMNENMMKILIRIGRSQNPVPISHLYSTKAERDEVIYLLSLGLLSKESYEDERTGTLKEGVVIDSRNRELCERLISDYNELTLISIKEDLSKIQKDDETAIIGIGEIDLDDLNPKVVSTHQTTLGL